MILSLYLLGTYSFTCAKKIKKNKNVKILYLWFVRYLNVSRLFSRMLQCRQNVMLESNVQPSFPPRILKLQRAEIISQTSLPRSYDGHQTEVFQFFRSVNRSSFSFWHGGHIELFDDQVDDLAGWGAGRHV